MDKNNTKPDSQLPDATVVSISHGWGISKRQEIIVFAVLIIMVIASVAALVVIDKNKKKVDTKGADTVTVQDYKSQKIDLENKLDKESKKEDKAQTLLDLSRLATQNNDNQAAIVYAQKSVVLSSDVNSNAVLAVAAEQAGNYEVAIAAYQKAASLSTKTDNPDENNAYNYYNGKAIYLSTKVKQ